MLGDLSNFWHALGYIGGELGWLLVLPATQDGVLKRIFRPKSTSNKVEIICTFFITGIVLKYFISIKHYSSQSEF